LLAVGFRRRSVTRYLLAEAIWPAGFGAAVGLLGAVGYSALMLAGLRTWWSDAVHADFLRLHVGPMSLIIGWAASLVIAMLSIAWAVRGLSRRSPRELLSGAREESAKSHAKGRAWISAGLAPGAMAIALLLIGLSAAGRIPPMPAFFGGGAATLVATLAALRLWTRLPRRGVIRAGGLAAIARLGIRNAARNPLRTLLTAGLVASASFIITAVGANRLEAEKGAGSFCRNGPLGASHKMNPTPFLPSGHRRFRAGCRIDHAHHSGPQFGRRPPRTEPLTRLPGCVE